MAVKEKFHSLIDKIEDDKKLEGFFSLISRLENSPNGQLYDELSLEQKEELDLSFDESFVAKNLVNHKEVKTKYSKWL